MHHCLICFSFESEIHHIKSRGSSSGMDYDHPSNIMHLCREHHTEFHLIGRNTFIEKYKLKKYMQDKGWDFDIFTKKWINPNMRE